MPAVVARLIRLVFAARAVRHNKIGPGALAVLSAAREAPVVAFVMPALAHAAVLAVRRTAAARAVVVFLRSMPADAGGEFLAHCSTFLSFPVKWLFKARLADAILVGSVLTPQSSQTPT